MPISEGAGFRRLLRNPLYPAPQISKKEIRGEIGWGGNAFPLTSGAGALALDAGQAAGRNRAVQKAEPDKRNWGVFGPPFLFLGTVAT